MQVKPKKGKPKMLLATFCFCLKYSHLEKPKMVVYFLYDKRKMREYIFVRWYFRGSPTSLEIYSIKNYEYISKFSLLYQDKCISQLHSSTKFLKVPLC